MSNYVIYVVDVESTGLDSHLHDVIELSLYRLTDNIQKTWCIQPTRTDTIDFGALRVNGHKLEDLKHETKYGRDTYKDPNKLIIDIENWISEDNVPTERRLLVGQNVSFDKNMLEQLWVKCNSKDSFPFGRRMLDTMQIEFFLDLCKGSMSDSYSLNALTKKYGIKNEKAHTAAADVKATKELFDKQIDFFKKTLNHNK